MSQSATRLPIRALSTGDRHAWNTLRASDPALASPYFSLAYLDMVDEVHPQVEVVRICEDGRAVAYLPLRRDMLGTARPADGPMGDLHGVIADPATTIDLPAALQAAGLGGYAYSAVPYQQARHGLVCAEGAGNQVMDLSEGYQAYLDERYSASSSFRRTHRKIDSLLTSGRVEISHDSFDEGVFRRLIELKQDGYAGAGHFDIFALGWPQALLRALAQQQTGEVRGVLSIMQIDGEFAAACLCMRSQSVLHYWFPGYEKAFADLKPGHAMLFSLGQWAAAQGTRELHLGLGDIQYKRQMASFAAPVLAGSVAVAAPQRLVSGFQTWSAARERDGRSFGQFTAKLARKVERVTMLGRLSA